MIVMNTIFDPWYLSRARLLLLILLLLARGERVRGGERDLAEVDSDRQVLLDRVVQQTDGQSGGITVCERFSESPNHKNMKACKRFRVPMNQSPNPKN
jgi:hypothetical protein